MSHNLLTQALAALEIACDHIDMDALAVSHATDLAKIRAARAVLAAQRERDAQQGAVADMHVGGTDVFGKAAIITKRPMADTLPLGDYELYLHAAPKSDEARDAQQGAVAWVSPSRGYNTVGYDCEKLNALPVGTKLYPHAAPQSDEARDAARYRWLRKGSVLKTYVETDGLVITSEYEAATENFGAKLDATIDSAMSTTKGAK